MKQQFKRIISESGYFYNINLARSPYLLTVASTDMTFLHLASVPYIYEITSKLDHDGADVEGKP